MSTLLFTLTAGAMALAAAAVPVLAMRRARRSTAATASRAAINASLLKQRLAELEDERRRGLIGADAWRAMHEDLQRRALVEVDSEGSAAAAVPVRSVRPPVLAVAIALPLVAGALYMVAGSPHMLQAQPMPESDTGAAASAGPAAAPAARAMASAPALLAQLEAHVASQPKDARAWVLLARARMDAGQFDPAAVAYQRAIDTGTKVAKDATVWCEYADAVGMAQGGRLAGKPRELIDRALTLDVDAACGLEMAGSAAVEARDFRAAQQYWTRLLAQLPEGSRQHLQLSTALERVTQQARFALPSD